MDILLTIVSILMIVLVLLQSGKAEAGGQIMTGGSSDLFSNRKERGGELFISNLTMTVGMVFFIVCLVMSFK